MFKFISIITLVIALTACSSSPKKDVAYPTEVVYSEEVVQPVQKYSKDDVSDAIGLSFNNSEWTKEEKIAFTLSVAAHMADLGTSLASDERCVESTPLLGKNPSNGALIGVKILAIGFEYWLYNTPRFSNGTHWWGFTSAIIHGTTAYQNSRNDCYD